MEIAPSCNPVELFKAWLEEAARSEPNDPEAMALATAGKNGQPAVRMVLLKGVDERGFCFYTNMESKKGLELAANPLAALCFHWKSLQRQVRVEGTVSTLPAADVAAYFKTRHPLSRLGSWASRQSQPLASRRELEERVKDYERKFQGQEIPCPPHWGGYRLAPQSLEFWQAGEGRLHDRFLFTRRDGGGWAMTRLNP